MRAKASSTRAMTSPPSSSQVSTAAAQGCDRGGSHQPQLEGGVAGPGRRRFAGQEGLEDGLLPALLTLDLVRAQPRALGHDPRLQKHAGAVVLETGEVLDQALADRAQRGLACGPLQQAGHEELALLVGVAEEQRFLGGEVAEEGAGGDVARLHDLLDGGAVEALLREQLERGLLQCLTGLELLALPQADVRRARAVHCPMMTENGGWRNESKYSLCYLAGYAIILTMSPDAAAIHARRWWTLSVLCLSLLIIFVGNTSLNVAIPDLSRELNATTSAAPVGRGLVLARVRGPAVLDRRARRPVRAQGHAAARPRRASSSARCSRRRRTTMRQLIVCRSLMGASAALIMPSTLSILVNIFPPASGRRRSRSGPPPPVPRA